MPFMKIGILPFKKHTSKQNLKTYWHYLIRLIRELMETYQDRFSFAQVFALVNG